jgi:hypothetical protein
MQRVSQSLSLPDRSDGSFRRKRRPSTARSERTIAPVGITTLAPVFTQALPVLGTVTTTYNHEFRAELLYDLCAALVRERLGGPETWRKREESAVVFAQRAIMESIGEERWNLLQRNVEYHLSVSDVAERGGEDKLLGNGRLAVTIECNGCGFLKVGPAIEALEAESPGLGAAFYWTLTYALYRVMRIYNHDDALQYEERMHEYAEDDEENREQYEFPEVEKALPECIQKTLTSEDRRTFTLKARRLLHKHMRGTYRSWIERLRTIERLSRVRLPTDVCFREDGGYDTIPLPSLLVAFKEHDAVVACFDEESQYMLEGSAEPTLGVAFSPQKPEEVRRALRAVGRFIAINHELFQLVESLAEWEKRHAGTHLDRGEPSLRAA